ncbi:hypothetical protein L226DRAFT_575106 [Lentinus tigrinus ALCF2SS1-7]|uniref:F-box domain-containing protein n=1 Tax=Lentinus tigrinus ALCF2SS1-6 TaxID=1328759 RepID=A0A5C2RTQ3_9APHY|nr:hypothetical protein L227DRAFT_657508 [Lentinus tigrinus ALCF2SS1-6]RPD70009.1 hypothetical protein L226DRAFT_575106 [Lentinus tigrinus ALCF2SS1-7]
MSIHHCPTELLELVVDNVTCQATLRNLRSVDSTFCALATPRAFHTAYVTNLPESATGLKSLMECDDFARHVHSLVFRWTDAADDIRGNQDLQRSMQVALISVFAQLHRFPALSALDLKFCPRLFLHRRNAAGLIANLDEPAQRLFLQSIIIQSLARNTDFPHIRSLTLGNLVPFPLACYQETGFAQLLEKVERLDISVHGTNNLHSPGQNTEELWEWTWQEIVPIRLLGPPQAQLTSLSITSDQPVGRVPHVELGGLFYPALQHLALGGVTFTGARRVEDFVARHRRTLTSLVLDSCPMHVTERLNGPDRTWAEVCDRFNAELQELVDLDITLRTKWGLDDMEKAPQMRLTYETSLTGFGYNRGSGCEQFESADRSALERLVAAVKSRKQRRGPQSLRPPPLSGIILRQNTEPFVVPIL